MVHNAFDASVYNRVCIYTYMQYTNGSTMFTLCMRQSRERTTVENVVLQHGASLQFSYCISLLLYNDKGEERERDHSRQYQ